jgi:hypothetical protein
MGATTSQLGAEFSDLLVDKTITILHTFLPIHYGDVVWALGTIGFKAGDLDVTRQHRLLAVLSRIYPKLHVRAGKGSRLMLTLTLTALFKAIKLLYLLIEIEFRHSNDQ